MTKCFEAENVVKYGESTSLILENLTDYWTVAHKVPYRGPIFLLINILGRSPCLCGMVAVRHFYSAQIKQEKMCCHMKHSRIIIINFIMAGFCYECLWNIKREFLLLHN